MGLISDEKWEELIAAAHLFLETMQPDRLAEEICVAASRLLNFSSAHLYLIEGETFILEEVGGILGVTLVGDETQDNLLSEDGHIVVPELGEVLNQVLASSDLEYESLNPFFPESLAVAVALQRRREGVVTPLGVLLLVDPHRQERLNREDERLLRELALFAAQALSIEHIIGERESRDGLTGLYNQRYFKRAVAREIERVRRYGGELSLLMIDIDRFKDVNDTYGHLVGDDVLKGVAQFISQDAIRLTDVASRYGGEEFAVLLVHTTMAAAKTYAERLREKVAAVDAWPRPVTVSCGVAELSRRSPELSEDEVDDFINRADKALYRAKTLGRNRVVADITLG